MSGETLMRNHNEDNTRSPLGPQGHVSPDTRGLFYVWR